MSKINKQIISSGNPFLDKIFNGGFQLGSIVLLVEDEPTKLYQSFIKYDIAEGIISDDKIIFYYGNKNTYNEVYNNLPYKSTQVENILNSQIVKIGNNNQNSDSSMKIAWRYENINYTNLIGDLSKNLKYIFDLSRPIQDNFKQETISKGNFVCKFIDFRKNSKILDIFNEICGLFQNLSSNTSHTRIIFANFCELIQNMSYSEINLSLNVLKSMIRSLNGYLLITANNEFLDKKVFNMLQYISDYVLKINPLLMVDEKDKVSNYNAIFQICKYNNINNIKLLDIETDIYGILKDKRKIIIEKIDIGVEIDRNTKVKECDLVKTNINSGNNDLDF